MPVDREVVAVNWASEMFLSQHSHSHSNSNDNEKVYELIKGYYNLPFRTPKDAFLSKPCALSRQPQENFEKLALFQLSFRKQSSTIFKK